MKNFYEISNLYWINFDNYLKNIWGTPSNNEIKANQVSLLRKRYYSNLTFLELIAKTFGEMGIFKQISLYALASGIGVLGLILVNPIFFIVGALSLNLLVFISVQYKALENRFSQMVSDLDESEKLLEKAVDENLELAAELRKVSEKHDILLKELEEGRLEVRKITESVREKKQTVEKFCEIIEDSAKKSHEIVEKLSKIDEDTMQKGENCIGLLTELSDIVTQALADLNYISKNPMAKELDEQNEYLTRLENYLDETYGHLLDDSDDEGFPTFSQQSFFSHQKTDHNADVQNKNNRPM